MKLEDCGIPLSERFAFYDQARTLLAPWDVCPDRSQVLWIRVWAWESGLRSGSLLRREQRARRGVRCAAAGNLPCTVCIIAVVITTSICPYAHASFLAWRWVPLCNRVSWANALLSLRSESLVSKAFVSGLKSFFESDRGITVHLSLASFLELR